MMTFLAQNLHALQLFDTRHEALIEAICNCEALTEDAWQVQETQDGGITLCLNGIPLQAMTGGHQEAKMLWKQTHTPRGKVSTHIILGFGMGFLAQLAARETTGQIVIYEDNLPLLKFLLSEVNFTGLFKHAHVSLVHTLDGIRARFAKQTLFPERMDVLYAGEGYQKLWSPEKHERISTWIDDFKKEAQLGLNTFYARHDLQVLNLLENLAIYPQWYHLEAFHALFKHRPAVVIGRGPSLDDALPTLKCLAEEGQTVLLAVGGALRRLSEYGIKPHFAFFYDPVSAKEQFFGLPEGYLEGITLIVPGFAPPETFTLAPQNHALLYCAKNNEFVAQFLEYLAKHYHPEHQPLGLVQHIGGGGVAVVSTEVAFRMGCSHVTLAGIDLAMKGNQVYAGGVQADVLENGVLTLHTTESHSGYTHHLLKIQGQTPEETLWTTSDFKQYRDELQFLRTFYPQQAAWNISVGGALVEGYTTLTPQALLPLYQETYHYLPASMPPLHEQIQQALKPLFTSEKHPSAQGVSWFMEGLVKEAYQLSEMLQTLTKQMHLIDALLHQPNRDTLLAHLPAIQQGTQDLLLALTANPLISHCASIPMMYFQQLYGMVTPKSTEDLFNHIKGQRALFEAMQNTLYHTIRPAWFALLSKLGFEEEAHRLNTLCNEARYQVNQTPRSLPSVQDTQRFQALSASIPDPVALKTTPRTEVHTYPS
jgi:hypothetical protein